MQYFSSSQHFLVGRMHLEVHLDSAVLIVVPKDGYDKVNESDKEVSQSHTTDQPTAL